MFNPTELSGGEVVGADGAKVDFQYSLVVTKKVTGNDICAWRDYLVVLSETQNCFVVVSVRRKIYQIFTQ